MDSPKNHMSSVRSPPRGRPKKRSSKCQRFHQGHNLQDIGTAAKFARLVGVCSTTSQARKSFPSNLVTSSFFRVFYEPLSFSSLNNLGSTENLLEKRRFWQKWGCFLAFFWNFLLISYFWKFCGRRPPKFCNFHWSFIIFSCFSNEQLKWNAHFKIPKLTKLMTKFLVSAFLTGNPRLMWQREMASWPWKNLEKSTWPGCHGRDFRNIRKKKKVKQESQWNNQKSFVNQ